MVQVSPTLWVVVAIPMAGVLWQTLVIRRWVARSTGATDPARPIDSARAAGLAFLSLTAAAFLAHVSRLRSSSDPGMLIDAVVPAAPIGALDTSLVLVLDRLSASAGSVACFVGLACAARLASRPSAERGWAAWSWLEFALASTLVCLLADGVSTLAVGWAMTTVAGAWILASDDARASTAMGGRGALAIAALLVGGAALVAALGEPAQSHFEVLRARLPGTPDSTVSQLPGPSEESAIALSFAPGDDATLVALGPTGSFRAMAEEFASEEQRTVGAAPAMASAEATELGKRSGVWTAVLAWIVGGFLMSRIPFSARSPAPLAAFANGLVGPTVGPILLFRMSFLWPNTPHARPLVAIVAGAALAAVFAHAIGQPRGARLSALANGTPWALTLLAIGLLSQEIAAVAAPVVVLAGSGFALVLPRSPRRGSVVSGVEEWVFIRAPDHFARFCARMDRWVVGAWIAAAGALARAAAWSVAAGEEALARRVSNRAASCAVRVAHDIEPVVGASFGLVVWMALALLAGVALAHALWFGS